MSQTASEALQLQYLRVAAPQCAERAWQRLFTDIDRAKLGGDFAKAYRKYKTVGMWVELRKVTFDRAVAELAYGLNFIDEATRDWLLREMGEKVEAKATSLTPSWDRDRRELQYGGKVARKVRGLGSSPNIVRILDAFEALGWPARIDDPLKAPFDGHRLNKTLFTLNRRLSRIRFHSDGDGRGIVWKPARGMSAVLRRG